MLKTNGRNLREALDAVAPTLTVAGRKDAASNAKQIVSAIIKASGQTKKKTRGKSKRARTGLVYGRIQSGKTRAMITSSALAFDNNIQVVVVITSNNNRLVGQTHQDFQNGLAGNVRVYSKSHFKQEVGQAKQILATGQGGIVLICSKGKTRLNQAIKFLHDTGAKRHSSVIFDDEGDQATLDTNTLKRSTKEPLVKPSKIHRLIHDPGIDSLRKALPNHVFVSVTGTPFGIVLQNIDNKSRPSFIELLNAGKDYIGGEVFFPSPKPNTRKLISLIDENERIRLLGRNGSEIPNGLKGAIRFFLLAASAGSTKMGWPDDGRERGYKLLCHPSVKTADQEKVARLVRKYLDELAAAINNRKSRSYSDLKASYDILRNQTATVPSFDSLVATIRARIASREVFVLNKNTTGDELNYSRFFNFLIGGNTLGRGLAIKKLLVTYYVREAKVTQMDTMYQHARMFGYRKDTLPYTRVFLPPQLYERFHQIFLSDEDLRKFIDDHKASPEAWPVRVAQDIRPTRGSVLDARKVDILLPGKQLFPNYPFYKAPATTTASTRVHKRLQKLFPNYRRDGGTGRKITTREAKELLALVKTHGTNVWSDKKIPAILSYLSQQFKNGVILKFRTAVRTAEDSKGLLSTGVLSGDRVKADAAGKDPVLWIFETRFRAANAPQDWDGRPYIYPTLVLPKRAELVVFNKS
jgi:Z1 domain/SWI2/SNF2 ATPase